MSMLIAEVVKEFYQGESSCHDFYHLSRVAGLAAHLCCLEGGSLEVVMAASYLHDLHRHVERSKGTHVPASECDHLVLDLLYTAKVSEELHHPILEAIHYTEKYSFSPGGRKKASIESRIVRDADNLDAIGAIGIARAFVYGGKLGEPIWEPSVSTRTEHYISGSKCPSVIHHFYQKLLRLIDDLDLPSAIQIAKERHTYLEGFLKQFENEWNQAMDGLETLPQTQVAVTCGAEDNTSGI
ncbi:hypothetical protein BZZ01_13945 [Nostocales cyanobacterium HT-58-2]|nr:hypothetical protein BZZ01_13945 [Nostocales cyanobacterium HT-58-2]